MTRSVLALVSRLRGREGVSGRRRWWCGNLRLGEVYKGHGRVAWSGPTCPAVTLEYWSGSILRNLIVECLPLLLLRLRRPRRYRIGSSLLRRGSLFHTLMPCAFQFCRQGQRKPRVLHREGTWTIRTDEKVVSCRVKVLEGAVEPQRHPAFLAIHVRLAWLVENLSCYRAGRGSCSA